MTCQYSVTCWLVLKWNSEVRFLHHWLIVVCAKCDFLRVSSYAPVGSTEPPVLAACIQREKQRPPGNRISPSCILQKTERGAVKDLISFSLGDAQKGKGIDEQLEVKDGS